MSEKVSRRDFLKLTGMGVAAAAVLTGCGPASRYVVRQPYPNMPEYNQPGVSTYFATTCRECSAGCGLILRTMEGRAIKAEGNPNHPVNHGKICPRGLTSVQGLYNPDRIKGPVKHTRGSETYESITWNSAIQTVADAFRTPTSTAFLLGLAPDHLFDFVSELTGALKISTPLRYGILGAFDGRQTLTAAAAQIYGQKSVPYFDLANADLVLSFGASFMETWLSPVSYALAFGKARRAAKRATLICLEPRQSLTAGNADEWYPIAPASEGLVAQAIGNLAAAIKGVTVPAAFTGANPETAAKAAGISVETLRHLAGLFVQASHPIVLPGGSALSQANGAAAAETILALNLLANNTGKAGGVFLPTFNDPATSYKDIQDLIKKMNDGQIKTLFIHGCNPVFELPAAAGFKAALQKVPQVISFSSFPDETALFSDFVFPDHTGLESFGYQVIMPGADRETVSAAQPVVAPLYDTRATVDVLLAAVQNLGGDPAARLNYTDEVDFLQKSLAPMLNIADGSFSAPEIFTFWAQFLQYGGWWKAQPGLNLPKVATDKPIHAVTAPSPLPDGQYSLVVFPTQLGDGSGANRPWLQETADPTTTVTWGAWIEINPDTAAKLGIQDDDIVKITSAVGEIELPAYLYPAIRPDTVAIPFGQGHDALGQYAKGRGANPARLMSTAMNEISELAFGSTRVAITRTDKKKKLARVESREGVYGKE